MRKTFWFVDWRVPVDVDRRTTGSAIVWAETSQEAKQMIRGAVGPAGADTMVPVGVRVLSSDEIVGFDITLDVLEDVRARGVYVLEWGT